MYDALILDDGATAVLPQHGGFKKPSPAAFHVSVQRLGDPLGFLGNEEFREMPAHDFLGLIEDHLFPRQATDR